MAVEDALDLKPGSPPTSRGAYEMIGSAPSFIKARDELLLAALHDVTVLIEGETGTGKELFARLLHNRSSRRKGPFVTVNCSALPSELAESEFFGHKRGAFTHAHEDRMGLIAEADGGTLFLDEVSSMELRLQAKLLRFMQEREFRRVGGDRLLTANVRVVAASNLDLEREAEQGRFRWDLFYRLRVFPLRVPPLRERREDIAQLLMFFLNRYALRFGVRAPQLSPPALAVLMAYSWPGNVRELENVAQWMVIHFAGAPVAVGELPWCRQTPAAEAAPDARGASFRDQKAEAVRRFETAYLEDLMRQHRGNVSRAAKAAGSDRRVLTELLKRNSVDPRRFRVLS